MNYSENEKKVIHQIIDYYGLNDYKPEELQKFVFKQLYKQYLDDFSSQINEIG
jgi:hypothetical protein